VYEQNGKIYTTTSRSIAIVGIAENIIEAERLAQKAMNNIKGKLYSRRDIGTQQLIQQRVEHMWQLRGT
jgi:phosphoribosylamine--glycine ligase